ncbi:VacJ family lipoprotein [Acinetobacter sp. KAM398]|uniref:MlaA family lipoprotein n=1 Tax=Acinetobacter TaxID=469 RepID=UPI00036BFAAA|nr:MULTISPECIES: VacJ family lipoprotein [unclassified Acinetobacter]GJC32076.1 VacJ family lipoprotein [Acinetobacter sp. KAM392]GJC34948.1 VacJ family lipoprotein [Acinetobacter sp. KAM393]GJC37706.1 VacJ family lipoprotein [Acinetobacter sp. KAM394]GJC40566.1 VacJ family lipoprotein [Acinetobacter sp. KAM395]GJC43425.1 VacJ family lipoprotein [Acinetobacter sp. KAM396]
MYQQKYLWVCLVSSGFITSTHATTPSTEEAAQEETAEVIVADSSSKTKSSRLDALKELKSVKAKDLKVNANAAQPDEVKDPLQPLNRQIYAFNDMLDRNVARPLALQYTKKVPGEVRGSYRQFRKNLGEPWNAVNQLIQGRPLRAAKTIGRFSLNTITTLGMADPARRLGLDTEEENFGTTLGYFGVPSGPYVMLPIYGPSTFRDGFGTLVDGQARPQKYILDDNDRLYWSEQVMRGVDTRSQLLDVEQALQGDKYAAIRDIYLQRKNFEIAEKKGLDADNISFVDDETEELFDDQEEINLPEESTK